VMAARSGACGDASAAAMKRTWQTVTGKPSRTGSELPVTLSRMSDQLAERYAGVRARTVALAAPLSPEDAQLQSMPDASPAKWHLAHTTWFFSRFALGDAPDAMPAGWDHLFNSYYVGAGARHERAARGQVSRPSLAEVQAWRREIDARVLEGLARGEFSSVGRDILLLGTYHEEQHQELLLTDIKHAFWSNPLQPACVDATSAPDCAPPSTE